ncbi:MULTISPECIES: TRAP transporter large permease [unclassified Oscillibacter]|uniref:TRAP transporter large permease n=1 Tax=unclassified Oscillibacter TaxID=2629304 RepID=UPI0025D995AE|nr:MULTISPECIES: TRAP transporter large permease [unclassified Oscillibacter]
MSSSLIILIVMLFGMLLIGAPVIMAIGTSALAYFFISPGMVDSLMMYAHRMFTGMDSFIYVCIPLFMLSGELMARTGLMDKIVDFARIFVGRLQGGVAYVAILANMMFGCVSGSGIACIAALGPIEVSMMEKERYNKDFSAALVATSALQGPIIPPSIPAVMFAGLTSVSVGAMFVGQIVPGVMLGVVHIMIVAFMARKYNFPRSEVHFTAKEKLQISLKALGAIGMVVVVLGGIMSGIFTATEASGIAVIYVLVLDLAITHRLKLSELWECLKVSAKGTATVYLIIGFTSVISWILSVENVPIMLSSFIQNTNMSPYLFLFLFNIFILFNGMWISDSAQQVLYAPIFTPLFVAMGCSPIHIGVVFVINIMIGMITPPFGMALYTVCGVTGCDLKKVVKKSLPFTIGCIFILFLLSYCPLLVLTLPRMLGYPV